MKKEGKYKYKPTRKKEKKESKDKWAAQAHALGGQGQAFGFAKKISTPFFLF